jgi:hypothetical protein
MEEQTNDEDIQDGTPVQANTVVANEKNLQQPSGTYGNLQEATYSNLQQDLRQITARASADLQQPTECTRKNLADFEIVKICWVLKVGADYPPSPR